MRTRALACQPSAAPVPCTGALAHASLHGSFSTGPQSHARTFAFGVHHCTPHSTSFRSAGGTGSYLYMAPEVKLDQPYSEKVDIFSLGVIMYELFGMNLMASIVQKSGTEEEFEVYATRVANGHREPMRDSWAEGLQVLRTRACWLAPCVCVPDCAHGAP